MAGLSKAFNDRWIIKACVLSVALVLALSFIPSLSFAQSEDGGGLRTGSISVKANQPGLTYTDNYGTWTYMLYDTPTNPVTHDKCMITSFQPAGDVSILDEVVMPAKVTDDKEVLGWSYTFNPMAKKVIVPDGIVAALGFKSDSVEEIIFGKDAGTYNNGYGSNVSGCPNLKALTLGENAVLANAKNLTKLESVDFGVGSVVKQEAFSGCAALTNTTGSPSTIGAYGFFECAALKSFDFSNVTAIGDYAFVDSGLEGSIDLPKCTSLGNQSFQGCLISSVVLGAAQEAVPGLSPFTNCSSLVSVTINGTIPAGSRTGLFGSCPNLSRIVIGENVVSIGRETFYGSGESAAIDNNSATMLYGEDYKLRNSDGEQVYPWLAKSVDPPTVITGLGDTYTLDGGSTYLYFYDYENGKLTIPSSVQEIQNGGLAGFIYSGGELVVAKIHEIDLAEDNDSFILEDGVLYDKDRTSLYKATVDVTSVSVPNTVTTIGGYAFQYCNKLTSVELPDGLKRIGPSAFEGCANLTSIDIPDSVEVIGSAAFAYCVGLTSFAAGGNLWTKSNIGDFVAEGGVPGINKLFISYAAADEWWRWESDLPNTSLTELDLSGLKSSFIPHYSFSGLTGITEVVIPAGVSQIGNGSFYYCKNLKDIYIYNPTSITIATSSGGQGDSGSGNPDETYAVSQPGSFAWWNNERPADASGTGAKYEDYTGLNFYGAAYSGNNLVKFCQNMQHNFIPVVILDNLAAAANPFATDAQTEYDLTYGTGANDYGYVAIADIQAGETPQVMAYFGDYGTPRDLTNDAACAITYYGPDGKATTSFDAGGAYTAFIEGDGKSVFGERTVSFNVKAAENPPAPAPAPAEKAISLSSAVVNGVSGKTYTGAAQTQSPVVKVGGKTLVAGTDYTVAYKNNVNAGTATMTITGKGKYTGSKSVTFAIAKASQKISAKGFKVTYKGGKLIKEGKLAKARTIKVKGKAKVSAKTAVKFKKANKAGGKKIKVNAKTGKITVKKGLKAGTYKVKVKITAAEGANYKAAKAKTITVRVIVKNK